MTHVEHFLNIKWASAEKAIAPFSSDLFDEQICT